MRHNDVNRDGVALLFAAAIMLSCSDPRAPVTQGVVRRDSAGIAIVESAVAAWGDASGWSIDTVAIMSLGATVGDTAEMFSQVVAAHRLSDGSVVVADGQTRQLRVFNLQGVIAKIAGRRGQGPGEFGQLMDLAQCGPDEIWVQDFYRISVWSLQLDFRREFKAVDLPMWPLICFDGRGVLVKDDVGFSTGQEPTNTVYSDSLELRIAPPASDSVARRIVTVPLWEYIVVRRPGGGGTGFTHPFGRCNVLAPDRDNLVIAGFFGVEVRTFGLDGQLKRIVRGPPEDLSISPALLREYKDATLDTRNVRYRTALESVDMPMPASRPAFTDLKVDSDGNVWVKRFAMPGVVSNRWGVFAAAGEFLGDLSLPNGIEIHEIGSDYLLATVRDTLDVPRVKTFRLNKKH